MAEPCPAAVDFLRDPASHGLASGPVALIETHMSWVFLAGELAYKLKKPVRSDELDFGSVEARCHFCHEELQLNRRLAPDVYLAVDTLSVDAAGRLHLGTDGERVDCVVRMRRLPEQQMLSHLLRQRQADAGVMERIAARIAEFHRSLPEVSPDPDGWRSALALQVLRNRGALLAHAPLLPVERVRRLCDAQLGFIEARADWFAERIREGHIVEGHGDLRAEHVFTGEYGTGAIDCLEFSRALRTLDTADDIGFLALDCERLQAAGPAEALLHAYWQRMPGRPPPALLHFYQALRASVRARLSISHLDEAAYRHSPTWVRSARTWLQLAQRHQDAIRSTMEPPL